MDAHVCMSTSSLWGGQEEDGGDEGGGHLEAKRHGHSIDQLLICYASCCLLMSLVRLYIMQIVTEGLFSVTRIRNSFQCRLCIEFFSFIDSFPAKTETNLTVRS